MRHNHRHTLPNRHPVSIHASVKDATDCRRAFTSCKSVSIHASVKDATQRYDTPAPPRGFNPRICKRCDATESMQTAPLCCFNPRICKRCDPYLPRSDRPRDRFNPRICKRCDYRGNQISVTQHVSIHASVKDATPCL